MIWGCAASSICLRGIRPLSEACGAGMTVENCYRRLWKKHSSGEWYPLNNLLEKHQIRGWRGVSAPVLLGRGLRKINVFSRTPEWLGKGEARRTSYAKRPVSRLMHFCRWLEQDACPCTSLPGTCPFIICVYIYIYTHSCIFGRFRHRFPSIYRVQWI